MWTCLDSSYTAKMKGKSGPKNATLSKESETPPKQSQLSYRSSVIFQWLAVLNMSK